MKNKLIIESLIGAKAEKQMDVIIFQSLSITAAFLSQHGYH
jgi:hypothetical protein